MNIKLRRNLGKFKCNILRVLINDYTLLRVRYFIKFKKQINFKNPKTWTEKILWRMLYERDERFTKLADKFKVRDFVKNKVGNEYLPKLHKVYLNEKDINYEELPNEFVIKCNHDMGSTKIIIDKNKIDLKKIKKEYNYFLNKNFYFYTREWHYKNIKPLIMIEEILKNNNGNELLDYKFHCFGGKVKLIQLANSTHTGNNIYNKDFSLMNINYYMPNYPPTKKPDNLEKMIKIAEKLSEDFSYVRVDLYSINEKEIKFGEMTFTPGGGSYYWNPPKINVKLLEEWLVSERELKKGN